MKVISVILFSVFPCVLFASSCGFSGQCVYNVQIHHCNSTISKRESGINCNCGDLEIVQGETYNIQSSLSTLEIEFNALVQKYQSTIASIKQKQQQLEKSISQNKALQRKIQSVDYLQTQTDASVARQTNNWNNEKTRLHVLTSKSEKDTQLCQATLASVTTNKGTGIIDTASKTQVSETFCGFEDSNMCGYKVESGSRWKRYTSTYSSTTGPKQDHTYGSPQGHYMMLDSHNAATTSQTEHTSRIDSPQYPTSASGYCVKFWYNMYGADITFLKVYAKIGGGLGYPVFTHTAQIDADWHQAQISLDTEYTTHPFQLVFETSTNAYYSRQYSSGRYTQTYYKDNSNTAIDDISVFNTSCNRLPKAPAGAYVRQNGSETSFYTFHSKPLSWYDAKQACRKENSLASLVSINSQGEQEYIVRTIKNNEDLSNVGPLGFYTSGNDERVEHSFEWTDSGTSYPVSYTNWHPGQPNNVGGAQDCLLLQYADTDFEWGDVNCADKHPYICEYHNS